VDQLELAALVDLGPQVADVDVGAFVLAMGLFPSFFLGLLGS
jgi:hypothetical protein